MAPKRRRRIQLLLAPMYSLRGPQKAKNAGTVFATSILRGGFEDSHRLEWLSLRLGTQLPSQALGFVFCDASVSCGCPDWGFNWKPKGKPKSFSGGTLFADTPMFTLCFSLLLISPLLM